MVDAELADKLRQRVDNFVFHAKVDDSKTYVSASDINNLVKRTANVLNEIIDELEKKG